MKQKFLLLAFFACLLSWNAARANESEPNNTRNTANTLVLNGSNSGAIGTATDVDWFKVTTTADGQLNLTLAVSNGLNAYFALYDNDGVTLLHQDYTSGTFSYSVDGLAVGTYYVEIFPYFAGQMPVYTLSNTLTVAALTNDAEPDSTRGQAIVLPVNGGKTGHIDYYYNHYRDSADWYKVTTNGDGALKLVLSVTNGQNVYFQLYDNDAKTLLHSDYTPGSFSYTVDGLAAGTYYIKIFTYYNTGFAPYTISDTLTKPTQANDIEPDSTRGQAIVLPLDGSKTGHIDYYYNHYRDTLDVYKVTTNADGALRLSMSSANGQNVYFQLYDNDEKILLHSDYTAGNFNYTVDGLAAGTYYIKVFTYYNTGFAPYTISDSLFLPAIANDAEPDSTKATALTLPLNGSVTGHVNYYYNNHRDSVDEYMLTTTADGNLNLNLTSANGTNVWFALYDNDGTTLLHQDYTAGNFNYNVDGLSAGTYYIRVFTYYNNQFAPYTLTNTLSTYNANDVEPNKYAKQAKTLNTNRAGNGHVGFYYNNVRDTTDWFKINYTGSGSMSVALNVIPNITGPANNTWMQIYSDTAIAPIYSNYTTTTETATLAGLAQGYYYVKIFEYYNGQFTAYTVTPTFTQVNKAHIKLVSADTAADCSGTNTLSYSCTQSHSPYSVTLFRFDSVYATKTVTHASTTFSFTNLPTGEYYAKVYGDGATGTAFTKTAVDTLMPVPTGLAVGSLHKTNATVSWNILNCINYYTLQYRKLGSGTWTIVKIADTLGSYKITGLTGGTTYECRLNSADSSHGFLAESAYTDSVAFTTPSSFANEDRSINDNSNSEQSVKVNVYPNPATTTLHIQLSSAQIKSNENILITLKDMNGNTVWNGRNTGTAIVSADVSKLQSGIYMLLVLDAGKTVTTQKVIITR